MKKLFLFDFDGVVVDSLDFYESLVRSGLETIGSNLADTRDAFLDLFDDNFYASIAKRGVEPARLNRAIAKLVPYADYDIIRPFDNLFPVVAKLRENHVVAVISSNSRQAIEIILGKHRCGDCFDDILGADTTLSKVEKIESAVERWNVEKDAAYYIGDTVGDVKEAKEAGIHVVAVTWGWHSRERLEKSNPDFIIESPEELTAVVLS